MTRWLEITLFISMIVLAMVIYWWFTREAPPVGGLAQ
jgi:hypothetical protein